MINKEQLKQKLKNLSMQDVAKLKSRLSRKKRGYTPEDKVKFSLFFFSDNGSYGSNELYELLLESAKYADQHGFHAIWIPERHFHEFGGPYPSPSVLLSAISMITERIRLHSGSVVFPLHHPVRIAEEWAIVDNLSRGRIGLSAASGWNRDDFILSQNKYEERKEVMFDSIEKIREIWRGNAVEFIDTQGHKAKVRLFPEPYQAEIPIWITSAGNPETWRAAGAIGAHVLTGLMEQTIPELGKKIDIYKSSLEQHGYDPDKFEVSVMLHTYVNQNIEQVKQTVRPALMDYLRKHMSLYEKHVNNAQAIDLDISMITEDDKNALIEMGFQRYFNHNALIGDQEKCLKMIKELVAVGVTEICCLINFGLMHKTILDGLTHLDQLKNVAETQIPLRI